MKRTDSPLEKQDKEQQRATIASQVSAWRKADGKVQQVAPAYVPMRVLPVFVTEICWD